MSKIRKRQTLTGKVIGTKMSKTVKVRVVREIPHPIYKKRAKRYKSYLAHVGSVSPNVGDLIAISATRPVSKLKKMASKCYFIQGINPQGRLNDSAGDKIKSCR